ncbi:glycosyltransferase family 4 protein [Fodinibius sediminis]|uniref:Glycosyltransferase involved in cell wall bisynthesis n=1 Tax=Fodinibius sediminis TaxID=1214077 RepID=A0A521E4S1_9BACT|nr:glycosyltransferase family 4 protein [Fodinibius sediminis]SMO78936.1 Glycosyltransferase involved in cell wall bisynthesis [Fodinibius sediminis]
MSQSVLILGSVWPEPGSSAAGRRMMQLISLFQQEGWKIIFGTTAAESPHAADLEGRGIRSLALSVNSSSFDDILHSLNPSMVLFDRFIMEEQFGWRVAEQCPDALRILDTEDLHCLRRARGRAVKAGRPFRLQELLQDDSAKREVASILRCDLSLIISSFEMDLLQGMFGVDGALLHYLPFLLEPLDEDSQRRWPSFAERRHFVTIGNFRHPPNWDAVRYLKQDIWPLIRRRLPEEELHIYGAYPSQKVWQLHKPEEGFVIQGRAEDAAAVVRQARVSLAPLRFGAGLKGKLVEAMQCGTPSVTTTVGAEGMAGDLPWSGDIAEKKRDIASAAVKLYTDRNVWQEAQQKGRDIINRRFTGDDFSERFIDRLRSIQKNMEAHRQSNFMGSLLMHHTAASTKYMSKWIEEKNRK